MLAVSIIHNNKTLCNIIWYSMSSCKIVSSHRFASLFLRLCVYKALILWNCDKRVKKLRNCVAQMLNGNGQMLSIHAEYMNWCDIHTQTTPDWTVYANVERENKLWLNFNKVKWTGIGNLELQKVQHTHTHTHAHSADHFDFNSVAKTPKSCVRHKVFHLKI